MTTTKTLSGKPQSASNKGTTSTGSTNSEKTAVQTTPSKNVSSKQAHIADQIKALPKRRVWPD